VRVLRCSVKQVKQFRPWGVPEAALVPDRKSEAAVVATEVEAAAAAAIATAIGRSRSLYLFEILGIARGDAFPDWPVPGLGVSDIGSIYRATTY
jgi:hypothetical protein